MMPANNNDYNGIFYTNQEHHTFMSRLSGVLHELDVDWFDEFLDDDDHDLNYDPNSEFFDDNF